MLIFGRYILLGVIFCALHKAAQPLSDNYCVLRPLPFAEKGRPAVNYLKWQARGIPDITDSFIKDILKSDIILNEIQRERMRSVVQRLISIIGVVESTGWRASLREIAVKLPRTAGRKRPSIHQIFTNCRSKEELARFISDVNHNLSLIEELPVDVYVDHRTKKAHDAYIAALEEADGRAMPVEIVNKLYITERQVISLDRAVKARYGNDLAGLNSIQRRRGRKRLIGTIHERTKLVQDEIIFAMQGHGGVGTPSQISNWAIGVDRSSAQRTLRRMDFGAINEIREYNGAFPLIVLSEKAARGEAGRVLEIPNMPYQVRKRGMQLYSSYGFGNAGRNAFRYFTIPFAYVITYKGANIPSEVKGRQMHIWAEKKDIWRQDLFEAVILLILRCAKGRELHQMHVRPQKARWGKQFRHEALIDYFRFAAPRALNACRYKLADVDVSKISPSIGSSGRIIRLEEEENLATFLDDLHKMTEQMLGEMERRENRKIRQLQNNILGSI